MAIDHKALPIAKPTRKRRVSKHTRKKATSERRQMEIRCDYLTKLLVHKRDLDRCIKCGGEKQLQAAHILPKGKYPLMRFTLLNLLTLCYHCHMHWAHKDPIGFTEWLDAKRPGLKQRLLESAALPRKVDLLELLIVLEAECAGGGAPR